MRSEERINSDDEQESEFGKHKDQKIGFLRQNPHLKRSTPLNINKIDESKPKKKSPFHNDRKSANEHRSAKDMKSSA